MSIYLKISSDKISDKNMTKIDKCLSSRVDG
nr:MAG TPA: hypothetical protein [Caudoviricetes sp.]